MAGFVKGSPIRHFDQTLFINDKNVPGVQSFQTNFEVPVSNLNHLGASNSIYVKSGPKVSSASISTLFLGQDLFLPYTGSSSFNLYVLNNENEFGDNYILNSCYLNSYRHSYSLNEYPNINVGITSYGAAGKLPFLNFTAQDLLDLISINASEPTGIFKAIHVGCLEELNFIGDSQLTSYEIGITVNRNSRYKIGKANPTISTAYPISITVGLSFDASQFSYKKTDDYPANENKQNINIVLKNTEGQEIKSYSFSDMIFTSQSYSLAANDVVKVNLAYRKDIYE